MANTSKTLYTPNILDSCLCPHKILLLKGMDKNHLISKDNMKEIVRLAKRSLQPQDEILKYTHTKVVGKPCFIRYMRLAL